MARPHPALVLVASDQPVPEISDFEAFMDSAAEHRMSGLVWTHLESKLISLPPAVGHSFFESDVAHWAHSMDLWKAWRSLAELGSELDIDLAIFKGIALEASFYGRTGERPCSDLDVLVDPSRIRQIDELLVRLGIGTSTAHRVGRMIGSGQLQAVTVEFDGVSVDLHSDLFKFGFPSRNPESIWESVTHAQGAEGPYLTLEPALSLLHVLLHLNRDRFRRLLGYVDARRIANSGLVDWDRFWAHAGREGLESIAREVLNAVNEVVPIRVPGIPFRTSTVRGWLWRLVWPAPTRLSGRPGRYRFRRRVQFILPLLCKGRTVDAIRYAVRRLFPTSDLLMYNHPGLADGPYPLRWARARLGDWRLHRSHHQSP